MVRNMKAMGILPPDLDHVWLNLPLGWAEYREGQRNNGQEGPAFTVTLGIAPTDEQWEEYQADLQLKMDAWKAEKARRKAVFEHAGDPRYDPMTGDLLLPDEHPLDASAEYIFDGKTRPRRFAPPGSPFINNGYKRVQTAGEQVPESEANERLVKRLLKAGFIEVEPTLMDKASFEKVQWFRSLSPSEKLHIYRRGTRRCRLITYMTKPPRLLRISGNCWGSLYRKYCALPERRWSASCVHQSKKRAPNAGQRIFYKDTDTIREKGVGIMAERGTEKMTEWLDIKLDTLSSEERLRLIEEIYATLSPQELLTFHRIKW
jgi:hypothetical protein